jgi:restriction system protein
MKMPVKSYYRVTLGRQCTHATECLAGGFIGADFGIEQDLSGQLPDEWRQLNAAFSRQELHREETR